MAGTRKESKVENKTNAERFIVAYNKIDYSLRTIYGFKRSISYADLIRKAVTMNSVVRKYEDELIDYGRLRNSIVHKTNPNYVIAEPHSDVVEEFEKIAKLISTPPTALERVCSKDVLIQDENVSLRDMIELFGSSGYSNIPIYAGTRLIGVASASRLIKYIGRKLAEGVDMNYYSSKTPIKEVIQNDVDSAQCFKVADKSLTIEKALNLFFVDRRLLVIIITENGTYTERPLGIITAADILDMNEVIENY